MPQKQAEQEYDVYLSYMHSTLLPKMKKNVLGFNDNDGNPQDPIYEIGEVITPGINLPPKMNHAQYIDKSGHHDILSYLFDHKKIFPGIFHIGVGQICPHDVTTEVDCESLFSQADVLPDARGAKMLVSFYERLVITKHRLHCIYCHLPHVKELHIKRFKSNDWDESAEQDAKDFLNIENDIFLEEFPMYGLLFDNGSDAEDNNANGSIDGINKEENEDDDKDSDDENDDDDDDGNKKPAARRV